MDGTTDQAIEELESHILGLSTECQKTAAFVGSVVSVNDLFLKKEFFFFLRYSRKPFRGRGVIIHEKYCMDYLFPFVSLYEKS